MTTNCHVAYWLAIRHTHRVLAPRIFTSTLGAILAAVARLACKLVHTMLPAVLLGDKCGVHIAPDRLRWMFECWSLII